MAPCKHRVNCTAFAALTASWCFGIPLEVSATSESMRPLERSGLRDYHREGRQRSRHHVSVAAKEGVRHQAAHSHRARHQRVDALLEAEGVRGDADEMYRNLRNLLLEREAKVTAPLKRLQDVYAEVAEESTNVRATVYIVNLLGDPVVAAFVLVAAVGLACWMAHLHVGNVRGEADRSKWLTLGEVTVSLCHIVSTVPLMFLIRSSAADTWSVPLALSLVAGVRLCVAVIWFWYRGGVLCDLKRSVHASAKELQQCSFLAVPAIFNLCADACLVLSLVQLDPVTNLAFTQVRSIIMAAWWQPIVADPPRRGWKWIACLAVACTGLLVEECSVDRTPHVRQARLWGISLASFGTTLEEMAAWMNLQFLVNSKLGRDAASLISTSHAVAFVVMLYFVQPPFVQQEWNFGSATPRHHAVARLLPDESCTQRVIYGGIVVCLAARGFVMTSFSELRTLTRVFDGAGSLAMAVPLQWAVLVCDFAFGRAAGLAAVLLSSLSYVGCLESEVSLCISPHKALEGTMCDEEEPEESAEQGGRIAVGL